MVFYCPDCQKKNEWPGSIMKSYGTCEVCRAVALCSDIPSKYLPDPPRFGPKNKELWE